MMKLLGILFFSTQIISLSVLMAQDLTRYTYHDDNENKVKEIYSVRDQNSNILEGKYLSFYLNGNQESIGQFRNNEPVGDWEFFYETGKLKMRMVVKGKDRGYWKYFYETGVLSMEGMIEDGEREGLWKIYFESGVLKREGEFKNNKHEGLWSDYFEDGGLKGEITFELDKGKYTQYYPDGKLRGEGPKSGWRNVGTWNYYYKEKDQSGKPLKEATGKYVNGKKVGKWMHYHQNGEISSMGYYLNDKPTGEWEYFYEDGNLSSKGTYEEGQKNGSWNLFYPNGNLMGKGQFNNGTGPYKEYYKNGNLKIEGKIVNGKNEGKWNYFYQNGKLEGECVFNDGTGTYYGYYPDGTLRTKGQIQDNKRVGKWELYENDGTLSGFYKPFYDDQQVSGNLMNYDQVLNTRPRGIADYRYKKRGFNYFDKKINEFQGIIISSNPLLVFLGRIPFGMEFYIQERLGHEFEFEGIRDPFFRLDSEIPLNDVFTRGYSIALKQKFYNIQGDWGLWYFGHELQFVNLGHNSNIRLPLVPDAIFLVNASEQKFLYHVLLGYKLMQNTANKGFNMDFFGGIGSGYRIFNVDEEFSEIFLGLPQGSFPLSWRVGFNFGYTFSFGHWK